MQKHLAPYTNRIQLADIQLFYAVQDTVADVCKIHYLAHVYIGLLKTSLLCYFLFDSVSECFYCLKHFVSLYRTLCYPI